MKFEISEAKNGIKQCKIAKDFTFAFGGKINPLQLAYETYGELSPTKDNVILIHHALSPNSHVSSHEKNSEPGWWEAMVGAGKPIDTAKYFVICINNIGSCFGSSGPTSMNPTTGKAYRADFPIVTMSDIVKSQVLLLECLGVSKLKAVIGNSMGGMLSLTFAIEYPDMVENLVSISACYKAYPANIANRVVQRDIIQLDPAWQDGNYDKNPQRGLMTARKLGHFTYRNPSDMNQKFVGNDKSHPNEVCEVESYLDYNASKFAAKFDTNSYLSLMTAMDLFDVTRGFTDSADVFKNIQARVLVVSVDSDILFTPEQQDDLARELRSAGVDATYIQHESSYGHDTFLVETDVFGEYISSFLNN